MTRSLALVSWLVLAVGQAASAQGTPAAMSESLLAADRAFAAAAATIDPVAALTAMFAADAIMPGPPGTLHRGAAAIAALRANPENLEGRLDWTPVRVGVSADGTHGFTFGFMTHHRRDGSTTPLKYMAYWLRTADGWRVAGYKRARRPEGEVSTAPMAPLLPAALVPVRGDVAHLDALRKDLAAAERSFSDEAQKAGLGAAFATWGSETAVNMGGPKNAGYVVGPVAIGRHVGEGAPGPGSPVEWSTEAAIVASSGDLGISFGYIRPNGPAPAGAPPNGTPFFTIWYRATPTGPWRYIAE